LGVKDYCINKIQLKLSLIVSIWGRVICYTANILYPTDGVSPHEEDDEAERLYLAAVCGEDEDDIRPKFLEMVIDSFEFYIMEGFIQPPFHMEVSVTKESGTTKSCFKVNQDMEFED